MFYFQDWLEGKGVEREKTERGLNVGVDQV